MITPQQPRNPLIKPRWNVPVGVMESIVAFNCRKYGFPIPVLAMPFWERAGNRAFDLSGHGNHGVLTGGPAWVPDGLDLDGSNDFILTEYAGIGGSGNRTVSARIKKINEDTGSLQSIFMWGDPTTGAAGERWDVRIDHINGDTLRVEVNSGYIYGSTDISDGNSHDVVCVLDGTDMTDTVLYVDGDLESIGGSLARTIATTTDYSVRIGSSVEATTPARFWDGIIDNPMIFDVALNATQVKFLHQHPYFMYQIPEELYGYVTAVAEEAIMNLFQGPNIGADLFNGVVSA